MKYGGPAREVEVGVTTADGRAVLTVRDHGPGLHGADPEEIFEPFVRGGDESVRTQQGVGLGLFIVRELVAAHGGTASARDGLPGGGTELRVELPLS
jgi:two-component system OmpR family sensor kinase